MREQLCCKECHRPVNAWASSTDLLISTTKPWVVCVECGGLVSLPWSPAFGPTKECDPARIAALEAVVEAARRQRVVESCDGKRWIIHPGGHWGAKHPEDHPCEVCAALAALDEVTK